ncbi:MAG: hypothetical protein M1828_003349 [Chrysothrix sp. TS-e1954]|nr:MAG: hypothetical protein M1828_003349 [Chrysothrix sp. TS-e1954]
MSTFDSADGAPDVGDQTGANALLALISDPFSTELQATSLYAALAWTSTAFIILGLLFCLLRPRTNAVYAPRAKHADEKHAPPPLGNGLFSWIGPVQRAKEPFLVERIGVDAVIFLRFLRMLRNIFLVLTVLGCAVLIPINLGGQHTYSQYSNISFLIKFTPQYIQGKRFWWFTIIAYFFDAIICGFVWWNYRAVLRIRRNYFQSANYQASLHSRTLILTHIPQSMRSDEGIARLTDEAKITDDHAKTAIARNVRDLPDLIEGHDEAVQKLEKILAKYLSNPNKLPQRPSCKPSKKDKARDSNREVDAIEYYTARIRELELEIKQVRDTVDKRNPLPYGFASYTHIENAHAVAYAARSKGPQGTTIRLAPKPSDLIWKNLPMTRGTRRTKAIWNTIWMTVLTALFIVPNILTAVFLSDFQNLGAVWPGFKKSLEAHPTWWGIASGILAPAFQNLFYIAMPIVFRRMLNSSGDTTKTSRERHVMSRLYIFFTFNNLFVFSVFAALWQFSAGVIAAQKKGDTSTFQAIKDGHVFQHIVLGLCNASTYWITWQLQHNFGVALDIVQYWPLVYGSLMRRFGSPTPRETIKLTAPPPIDYASYYNNYLFAATVGFCFATVQPLILPATALYIGLDAWLKKYMMLYVAITKTESGGLFWRVVINRLLFATLLGNCTIALVVGGQGLVNAGPGSSNAVILYALAPLPFLLLGFKIYLSRAFDSAISYYTTRTISDLEGAPNASGAKNSRHNERVGVRFGNPALYKRLMTPMVSARSKHLLSEIYTGRIDADGHHDGANNSSGYSDVYMRDMSASQPGKPSLPNLLDGKTGAAAGFELVPESEMEFANFKKRAEFREEFGGDGELYGRADDEQSSRYSRPSSMSSTNTLAMMGGVQRRPESPSRPDSRASSRTRYDPSAAEAPGTVYPKGYHTAVPSAQHDGGDISTAGHPAFRGPVSDPYDADPRGRLTQRAAPFGRTSTNSPGPQGLYDPYDRSVGNSRPGSSYGGLPSGLTPGLMQGTPGSLDGEEETSYDYFRRPRGGRR